MDGYWMLNNLEYNPEIFEIDYLTLQQRIEPFKEELIQKCFHPNKLFYYLEIYNYDIGDDEYLDVNIGKQAERKKKQKNFSPSLDLKQD